MTSKETLEVLDILKKLFIPTSDYESTYYDLGNGVMTVDSFIHLSEDEIKLIEEWLENEKER